MGAKYGIGTYGTDLYSFGYTEFAGVVSVAPVLSGTLLRTRNFVGGLEVATALFGNLNRAGVQQFEGELTVSVGLMPVRTDIIRGLTGTLAPEVVLSAPAFRNLVQRLSGVLTPNIVLSGHFGRDRRYEGTVTVQATFSGDLFGGPMWNEVEVPNGFWTPIPVTGSPWTNIL